MLVTLTFKTISDMKKVFPKHEEWAYVEETKEHYIYDMDYLKWMWVSEQNYYKFCLNKMGRRF